MTRRKSTSVQVGHVTLGGDAPIVVQSMTDTPTADLAATTTQILALANAGSELVRITVDTKEAARQVPYIKERLLAEDCQVPLIGDFHYNGHLLLTEFPDCAKTLDKYRINPGNVGFGRKKDEQFAQMIDIALKHDKPVRIGVNWGSLDQGVLKLLLDENSRLAHPKPLEALTEEALIASALDSATYAKTLGLGADKIVISCKVSTIQTLIAIYTQIAERSEYTLHLGLTEAGMGSKGIVASSIAMGILLQNGIGDTIRTSLTPEPGTPRAQEVLVSQQILQTLGLRNFMPMVTACPGCGRTSSDLFRRLAAQVQTHIQTQMPRWKIEHPGVENMTLAVMGCVVNGPGESKHANVGISLPGSGEDPSAPVYIDGQKAKTLRGDHLSEKFLAIVDEYVQHNYKKRGI